MLVSRAISQSSVKSSIQIPNDSSILLLSISGPLDMVIQLSRLCVMQFQGSSFTWVMQMCTIYEFTYESTQSKQILNC